MRLKSHTHPMTLRAIVFCASVITAFFCQSAIAKTLGEWEYPFGGDCVSIQEQSGSFLEVYKSCTNAKEAPAISKLKKIGTQSFQQEISPRPKWHYRIDQSGSLEIRDSTGVVNTLKAKTGGQLPKFSESTAEEKTRGLTCAEIGYRYGYAATKAMLGEAVDPSWDFVVPVRCRNSDETTRAISVGTKAASRR